MINEIGLSRTFPPESSVAICAAGTGPWPGGVGGGPFMSVEAPLLARSSEIFARAADVGRIPAARPASKESLLPNICLPPLESAHWPLLLVPAGTPSRTGFRRIGFFCNYFGVGVNASCD